MRACAAVLLLLLASPCLAGDDDCLACHGDKEARSAKGRSVFVDASRHKASVHASLSCSDCHGGRQDYPHPKQAPKASCAGCHEDAAKAVTGSAHGGFGAEACTRCHGPAHGVTAPGRKAGVECAVCHDAAVKAWTGSVHARKELRDGATCRACHGPAHGVTGAADPKSAVSRRALPNTCGSCHANPEFLAKHKIPFARPVEAYRLSVHGRAVAAGRQAASCSDCHGNHGIVPAREAASKINHWNVAATCGACHQEIAATYAGSVHGQAMKAGVRGAPICTDCHGEHAILAPSEPGSLVNPARVSSKTCGHCHADERLAERYNLPQDKVPAYQDSFHGLASRSGKQTVANCASCHGVHNILASSDPKSTVHPENVGKTCGACHPGAGQRFVIGPVHVRPAGASEHGVVRVIRIAYLLLIPLTIGFMLVHHGLDFVGKLVRGVEHGSNGEEVPRMNLHFRIAHWLTVLSFPVLVVTGFALKFPESFWAQPLLAWESQVAFRGWTHRIAGIALLVSLGYHVVHLLLSRPDRGILRKLLPTPQDARELLGVLRYNLGRSPTRPSFGVFNYVEKAEYWAYLWGSLVMAASGFLLWFNSFTLRHFPGWVADAATAVHYYEAILATLSILVWHLYTVVFDPEVYPMDKAWITGKASAAHLRHTRPEYYRSLVGETGETPPAASGGPVPAGPPRDGPTKA